MLPVFLILCVIFGSLSVSYMNRTNSTVSFYMNYELDRISGSGPAGRNFVQGTPWQKENEKAPKPEENTSSKNDKNNETRGSHLRKDSTPLGFFPDLFSSRSTHRGGILTLPSIAYKTDSSGTVLETFDRELGMDEPTADLLISQVLSSVLPEGPESFDPASASGLVKDMHLRYKVRRADSDYFYIVFCDTGYLMEGAQNYLLSLLFFFIAALVLFFLLSVLLSRWALTPAEKAWEQQNRFVADASHELKTPLTVILANLDIIAAHRDSTVSEQKHWLDNTREEARRMQQLVTDLLFLARSDAGRLPEAGSEVSLSDCAEDRVLSFEAVAFEKGAALDSELEPGLIVYGNAGSFKQLITILLDNAVKYCGSHGTVSVTLKRRQDHAVLKVKNSGEPIPPEDLPHLFERFYRTDKSRTRTEGGYGLGLAIAESIVHAANGSIRCSSSAEEGTIFTVELPLAK